jgi:Uma2 family endonuclease
MAEPARRRATYEDVLNAPAHLIAEILEGELHLSPHPSVRQALAQSVLGMDLGAPFQRARGGPGGWWILLGPELHLGSETDIIVPDVAGWRMDRMPEVPPTAYLTLAPDWACEVLSDSTRRIDRGAKMRIYAREGVSHVWLVDPIDETLEVFRLDGASYLYIASHQGDVSVGIEPFEAVELELAALWGKRAK